MMASLGRSRSVLRIVWLVLVNVCGILFVGAVSYDSYEFGQDCIALYEIVSTDKEIYVLYSGEYVTSVCDEFPFRTKWSGSDDASSYKICIEPMYFKDPDCSVRLDFKASIGGHTLHNITCLSGNSRTSFCGDYGDDLHVYFEESGLSTSNARFKFIVYVEEKNEESALGWAIFGAVVGVLIFFTLVAALVFWRVCRRKPIKGHVLTSNQESSSARSQPENLQAAYTAPHSSSSNTNISSVDNYGPQYATGQPQY